MGKHASFWWWIFGSVIVGVAGNIYADDIEAWLKIKPANGAMATAFVAVVALLALITHGMQRRSRLRAEFDLYRTSEALKPEDVGFKKAKPGEVVAQPRRPYYSAYIQRFAIPYGERHRLEPSIVHSEDDLLAMLRGGESILLVGVPTEGKTRTLFELVRMLRGFTVVRPKREGPPSDDAIALLKGRKVVCLLDDINSYAGTHTDLYDFYRRVADKTVLCVLAGATRDGPELDTLKLRTTPLHQLYELVQRKLQLQRASDDDKERLIARVGAQGDTTATTLGSICMRGAYGLMVERFGELDDVTKSCHRAIQLLATARVEPFTHARIHQVMTYVFKRDVELAHLRDHLAVMTKQGFLVSGPDSDPVSPETAYFTPDAAGVFYFDDRPVKRDVPRLADALVALGDAEGVFAMAWACGVRNDTAGELAYYDAIIGQTGWLEDFEQRRFSALSLFNKGVILGELGQYDAAVAVYDTLIERDGHETNVALREHVASASVNKGATLVLLGRCDEGIAVYELLIEREGQATELVLREEVAKALFNKGATLGQLDRSYAAIAVYETLIKREGSATDGGARALVAKALFNKGRRLGKLGRPDEEIATYDTLIERDGHATDRALREQVGKALLNKGWTLGQLGQLDAAIDVFDMLIEREAHAIEFESRVQVAAALSAKGAMLRQLDRLDAAIAVYDSLIERAGSATEAALRELAAEATASRATALESMKATGFAGSSSQAAQRSRPRMFRKIDRRQRRR